MRGLFCYRYRGYRSRSVWGKGGLFGKTPALVGFDGPPFLDQQLTEYMLPQLKGHLILGTESEI